MRVDLINCGGLSVDISWGDPPNDLAYIFTAAEARELHRLLGEVLPPVPDLHLVRCCASCGNSRGGMDNMWCHENRNWKIYPDMVCDQHTGNAADAKSVPGPEVTP